MKFVHGLLLGSSAALGLGYAARFIYSKIIKAKRYKFNKALDDFLDFKDDKKYIELNLGLENKYVGVGIFHVVKSKGDSLTIDLSKYKEKGDPIGITLGSEIVDEEDQYIIPEIEVYQFKNGFTNYRFHQERGIIDPDDGLVPFD